jgi:hypothetical protein
VIRYPFWPDNDQILQRSETSRCAKSCPLLSGINCAGNLFEAFHSDRFEQDVVTKT